MEALAMATPSKCRKECFADGCGVYGPAAHIGQPGRLETLSRPRLYRFRFKLKTLWMGYEMIINIIIFILVPKINKIQFCCALIWKIERVDLCNGIGRFFHRCMRHAEIMSLLNIGAI